MVPLGAELLNSFPKLADSVQFIFPAAPLSLDELGMYGARAWWHLDMARMTAAIEQGEFRDLRNELPDGMPEAEQMLRALIGEVATQTGMPTSKFVLGGFSQGSMLATDVALKLPEPPAGLCIFSGTLLCESNWRELAAKQGPLRVLQSHGRQDSLLPFQAAEWLRDLLIEAGMEVDFIPFDGDHTIPLQAMRRFATMLEQLVG